MIGGHVRGRCIVVRSHATQRNAREGADGIVGSMRERERERDVPHARSGPTDGDITALRYATLYGVARNHTAHRAPVGLLYLYDRTVILRCLDPPPSDGPAKGPGKAHD